MVVGALDGVNDGDGPGFVGTNFTPVNGPGVTVGIIYNLMGGVSLEFGEQEDVLEFHYDTVPTDLIGDENDTDTQLAFAEDLGDPLLPNAVVVAGVSFTVESNDATITLHPVIETAFIRGDANDDGRSDIGDGIWILNGLFLEGPESSCAEAADANDDGANDQSDAIYIFNYRFLGGNAPPAPFPNCGVTGEDPIPDCVLHDFCD